MNVNNLPTDMDNTLSPNGQANSLSINPLAPVVAAASIDSPSKIPLSPGLEGKAALEPPKPKFVSREEQIQNLKGDLQKNHDE